MGFHLGETNKPITAPPLTHVYKNIGLVLEMQPHQQLPYRFEARLEKSAYHTNTHRHRGTTIYEPKFHWRANALPGLPGSPGYWDHVKYACDVRKGIFERHLHLRGLRELVFWCGTLTITHRG